MEKYTHHRRGEGTLLLQHGRLQAQAPAPDRFPRHARLLFCCLATLLVLVSLKSAQIKDYSQYLHRPAHPPVLEDSSFDWYKVQTRPHLDYLPCYGYLQCARLELPLDYWNGTTNSTISLAVIRQPALVPVTDPRYRGAIITNPGGPGGSGVSFTVGAGRALQFVVDVDSPNGEDARFYDILSFDPRGVGVSSPPVHCLDTPGATQAWHLRIMDEGVLTSSDAAFGQHWSMVHALGSSCGNHGDDDIKRYITTASVAKDMLGLVEAHGQWRETEARRLTDDEGLIDRLKYKIQKEKIQYWGFSYGTLLGSTFAALFPDRVGRFILDGVVDAEDYTAALWSRNLQDTEKDMQLFYHHCARAGFPACELASPGSTQVDVETRVQRIIESTYHNPVSVRGPSPEIITYSDLRSLVFSALYSPVPGFPLLSRTFASVEKGDGTEFAAILRFLHEVSCSTNSSTGGERLDPFAGLSILCGDGDDQADQNKTSFATYLSSLQEQSPTAGDILAQTRLYCIGWTSRPSYRFTGPWISESSHPILWIGNTADPVTPIRNAEKMAEGYKDSVVLTQDSPGHCSIAAFSACTVTYVKKYFATGELPLKGTVCPVDQVPFGHGDGEVAVNEELRLGIQMYEESARALYTSGGGLMRGHLGGRVASWI